MTAGKCGTYAGYQTHVRLKESPCSDCRQANSVYHARRRAREGGTRNALVPYPVLARLLRSVPSDVREWATEQLGDAVVTRAVEGGDPTP